MTVVEFQFSLHVDGVVMSEWLVKTDVQEIKWLKEQLKSQQNAAVVEVECQLADATQRLLLEVTALRAKLAEMHGDMAHSEKIVRARLKDDYEKLIRGLFEAVFQLNHRFDEFRLPTSHLC